MRKLRLKVFFPLFLMVVSITAYTWAGTIHYNFQYIPKYPDPESENYDVYMDNFMDDVDEKIWNLNQIKLTSDTQSPSNISNLAITSCSTQNADGGLISCLDVSWTDSSNTDIAFYEVRYKPQGDSTYSYLQVTGLSVKIIGLKGNTVYCVSVKAVDKQGNSSGYPADNCTTTSGADTSVNAPSGLAATAGFGAIWLDWTNPADKDLSLVEIWRADSNDRSFASLIAEVKVDFYADKLGNGVTKYYWIRSKDLSGNVSTWEPAGATSGISSTTVTIGTVDIENAAITNQKIANATIDLATKVQGLLPNANLAQIADPAKLADAIISAAKIQTGAVDNTKILDGTIQGADIAAGTITGTLIAADTIAGSHIIAGTITSSDIAADTITANNIAVGAVQASEIAASAITATHIGINQVITNTANIADGIITSAKIANATIQTANIMDSQITSAKIADATITDADIGNATITGAKIANATITDTNIANATITSAKIVSLSADRISAGTITGSTIRTSAGNERIEISQNSKNLTLYSSSGIVVAKIGYDSISGTATGNAIFTHNIGGNTAYATGVIPSAVSGETIHTPGSSADYWVGVLGKAESSYKAYGIYGEGWGNGGYGGYFNGVAGDIVLNTTKYADDTIQNNGVYRKIAYGIIGRVNGDGSIAVGEGFTVSHPATGQYTITFTNAFAAAPVVVATAYANAVAQVPSITTGSATIYFRDNNSNNLVDTGFSFMAITVL